MKRVLLAALTLAALIALASCSVDRTSPNQVSGVIETPRASDPLETLVSPTAIPPMKPTNRQPLEPLTGVPVNSSANSRVAPFDSDYFTIAAAVYAEIPDLSESIGAPLISLTLGGNGEPYPSDLTMAYAVSDTGAALKSAESVLGQAGFTRTDLIGVGFQTPPDGEGVVYFRGTTIEALTFVSLSVEGKNIVVRCSYEDTSYLVDGEEKYFDPPGGDGSNFKGALFDRGLLDKPIEYYAKDMPDPSMPIGVVPKSIIIGGENRITYTYSLPIGESDARGADWNDPDIRAESFRRTMEAFGFDTYEFSTTKAEYIKGGIRVRIAISDAGAVIVTADSII